MFGNGLTSAFNLLGVCIIAIAGDIAGLAISLGDQPCHEFAPVDDGGDLKAYEECAAYVSLLFCRFSTIVFLAADFTSRTAGPLGEETITSHHSSLD